jgi:hypothetical protein
MPTPVPTLYGPIDVEPCPTSDRLLAAGLIVQDICGDPEHCAFDHDGLWYATKPPREWMFALSAMFGKPKRSKVRA